MKSTFKNVCSRKIERKEIPNATEIHTAKHAYIHLHTYMYAYIYSFIILEKSCFSGYEIFIILISN